MGVVVARVVVPADEVPSLHDASRIEVVDRVDAGIDHRDRHALAAGRVPGPLRSRRLEVPLPGEVGVVGNPQTLIAEDRLGPDDVLAGAKLGEHGGLGAGLDLQLEGVFG